MRFKFGLFVFFFIPYISVSQGIPSISNYTPDIYQKSPQNWAITQDTTGYVYFGNSAGLIQFDGHKWRFIHIKNNNIVSALYTTSVDRILIGGYGEFGFLESDSLNQMRYKSFSSELATDENFTYIWDITEYKDKKYFRSQEAIFVKSRDSFYTLKSSYSIGNLEKTSDQLFVWLLGKGLHYIKNKDFEFIEQSNVYSDDLLYDIVPFGNRYLLCFRKAGLVVFDGISFHPFDTPVSDYIKEHSVYKAKVINDSQFAFATLNGGIVIADMEGNIDQVISKANGLQANGVHGLFVDREATLWAALDGGISRINVNNPIKQISESSRLSGIVLKIGIQNEKLWIATTDGIFTLSNNEVSEISLPAQRVYNLHINENYVLAATNRGVFKIRGTRNRLVTDHSMSHLVKDNSKANIVWGNNSSSVFKLNHINNNPDIEVYETEANLLNIYEMYGYLWVLTHSQKVLKLSKDGTVLKEFDIPLGEKNQFETIGKLNNQLKIGTTNGLYSYQPTLESFTKDSSFNDPDILNKQVFSFQQCASDEIWFRVDRQVKRALLINEEWRIYESPFQTIGIGQDTSINDIFCDDETVWFGGTAGIYHLSDPEWKYDYEFNTNITGLLVNNDSLIYGGYGEPDKPIQLSYEDNHLRFTYAAASYIAPEQNMYKVRLRGYENGWSNWTSETEKDYTFIPEGTYTFEVQGRNVYHKTGSIDSFTFTVLPPWHRTWWAYSLYLLLIGGAVYGIHRLRVNRILREQRIRNRIASDLHDEVSATLSSITYFAQAIRQTQNGGKSERFVGLISESASDAKEKITDIIWSIDPENDDWVNLLAKCRRFASDLFESKDMDYDLDIDTDIARPLDIELRQHLWLIYKEMVINAARHSGARKVDISFGMKGNTLRLVVQDNGKGMAKDSEHNSGHGIKNIKKRVGKIGAELQLETDSDIGTRWIMTLKMP